MGSTFWHFSLSCFIQKICLRGLVSKKLQFHYNFHGSFTRHRIVFVATLEFNASLEVAIDSATGKRQSLAIGNVLAMSRLTSVIERNRYFHKQQVSHYFNWTMLYNLQRTDNRLLRSFPLKNRLLHLLFHFISFPEYSLITNEKILQ